MSQAVTTIKEFFTVLWWSKSRRTYQSQRQTDTIHSVGLEGTTTELKENFSFVLWGMDLQCRRMCFNICVHRMNTDPGIDLVARHLRSKNPHYDTFFSLPSGSRENMHVPLSSKPSALLPPISLEVRCLFISQIKFGHFLLVTTAGFNSHTNRSHKDQLREKCAQPKRKLAIYWLQMRLWTSKQGGAPMTWLDLKVNMNVIIETITFTRTWFLVTFRTIQYL